MTAGMLHHDLVAAQERKLATGVFGAADDIRRTAAAYYRGLGRLCAHRCGVEGLDAAAAPQVESLRRGTLDSALRAFLAGDDDEGRRVVRAYLDLASTARSTTGRAAADLSADTAERDLPHALRGWRGHPIGEEVVARFNASMATASDAAVITAVTPTPEHDAALARTLSTLDTALPLLGRDTVRSVAGVGLFAGHMGSGYYAGTPLLIYVNAGVFADEAEAAEIVLHESLHQKLADIGVAREVLRRGYVDEDSHRVPVPWGGGHHGSGHHGSGHHNADREFSVDRALAAYHVYTHQAVLYLSLLGHDGLVPQGPAVLARRLATSWARARHFAVGTSTTGARAELGVDGWRLTSWLAEVVEELGDAVLPGGSPLRAHEGAFHG